MNVSAAEVKLDFSASKLISVDTNSDMLAQRKEFNNVRVKWWRETTF
jgi:hypothetical protein